MARGGPRGTPPPRERYIARAIVDSSRGPREIRLKQGPELQAVRAAAIAYHGRTGWGCYVLDQRAPYRGRLVDELLGGWTRTRPEDT